MFSSIPVYGALQLILADRRLEQLRPAQFLIRGLPKLNIIDVLTACLVDLALRCALSAARSISLRSFAACFPASSSSRSRCLVPPSVSFRFRKL